MKYQFCIRFTNTTVNSAATKAVVDCSLIFKKNGYEDYTFTVTDNADKAKYYRLLFKELVRFYFAVKKKSVIGIQYPLLSINNVFKHFIKISRLKGTKFFCVIHDLESLRTGGNNKELVAKEIENLNCYDCIIAHNNVMIDWLKQNGLTKKAISLELFDYLSDDFAINPRVYKTIVFAGNLIKSNFIYSLYHLKNVSFNVYGPNFNAKKNSLSPNVHWQGEYGSQEIVKQLSGDFGLIWDGDDIEKCDDILGNYLKYNNPHKFSLYIAAGLPVIAPADSAIGQFIKLHNIGLLINNLYDLDNLEADELIYTTLKANVLKIRERVINGSYFTDAVHLAESSVLNTGNI